jgi:hypothetical protein
VDAVRIIEARSLLEGDFAPPFTTRRTEPNPEDSMTRETDPLPTTTDDPTDVTAGEMLREAIFFAAIVGAIAGGGYGLFAGWAEWSKAVPAERKSAAIIALWGLAWAAGGAIGVGVLCGIIGGVFAGVAAVVKKMAGK